MDWSLGFLFFAMGRGGIFLDARAICEPFRNRWGKIYLLSCITVTIGSDVGVGGTKIHNAALTITPLPPPSWPRPFPCPRCDAFSCPGRLCLQQQEFHRRAVVHCSTRSRIVNRGSSRSLAPPSCFPSATRFLRSLATEFRASDKLVRI